MVYQEITAQLEEVCTRIPKEQADYIKKYLTNAPYWVIETMQLVKKDRNTVFIEENTPADYVYILLEGGIRAVDYRVKGFAFDYMRLDGVSTVGSMECYFKIPNYMTTLATTTPCTFLIISRKNYEKWIWDDKNALQMDVASMGAYLMEQTRVNRLFLFLQGTDRFLYMFAKNYEKSHSKGEYRLDMSRQELAERSGFSIKTVNRSVKKMEEDGFISRKGHKIIISRAQYERMRRYLDEILDRTSE